MLFDSETGSFEDYNTACGVNGDKISNIIVDRFSSCMVTTSREVKEFNPKNGAYRSFYASSKNIGFNRFLPQSVFEDADGNFTLVVFLVYYLFLLLNVWTIFPNPKIFL